jgi:hypothetical protein
MISHAGGAATMRPDRQSGGGHDQAEPLPSLNPLVAESSPGIDRDIAEVVAALTAQDAPEAAHRGTVFPVGSIPLL